MKMFKTILSVSLMLMSASAMAAGEKGKQSLYDKLGGKDTIQKVVDNFVAKVGNDKRINHFFAATVADEARMTTFKTHMVNQICQATGGPCTYTGKDMKSTHQGMAIHGKDFDALVENLKATLDEMKVAKPDQAKLISVLKPMKKDIVEKK
jgi:hemoglobin